MKKEFNINLEGTKEEMILSTSELLMDTLSKSSDDKLNGEIESWLAELHKIRKNRYKNGGDVKKQLLWVIHMLLESGDLNFDVDRLIDDPNVINPKRTIYTKLFFDPSRIGEFTDADLEKMDNSDRDTLIFKHQELKERIVNLNIRKINHDTYGDLDLGSKNALLKHHKPWTQYKLHTIKDQDFIKDLIIVNDDTINYLDVDSLSDYELKDILMVKPHLWTRLPLHIITEDQFAKYTIQDLIDKHPQLKEAFPDHIEFIKRTPDPFAG